MPSTSSPFGPRSEPICVLVADDFLEIQRLLQQWLGDIGCEVVCVSTGNEAARFLRDRQPDVVITDVLMPEGDGLEVIALLKQIRSPAKILAISGGGHHLRADDCLKLARGLGADGLLMKPFNRQQLIEALGAILAIERPASTA